MRKLCPNLERDDALDTVLEVPIPEEMFTGGGGGSRGGSKFGCTNVKAWMRSSHAADRSGAGEPCSMSRGELQLMLGVIGAPLIPLPVHHAKQSPSSVLCEQLRADPIESSTAKYIVQQYIAASGGEWALNKVTSMYAMGKVRMTAAELNGNDVDGAGSGHRSGGKKGGGKQGGCGGGGGEMGGFVLWQKKPELWCLELVVSGCKISAGSDGKVAWRQTPWHQSHASRGPPRPLRRSLQGLDPQLTASLFADSVCIGERSVDGEDCFVLKVEAEASSLRARNSSSVEIIRHTVWGYFSQRTGLLVQLEDSHLLQIRSSGSGGSASGAGSIYWETTMESRLDDYRAVDGVNIAHAGRTAVSLVRFGDCHDGNTRTRMEEAWNIEEVDFNIWGLSMDCFLPPSDLREGKQEGHDPAASVAKADARPPPLRIPAVVTVRVGPSQVAAVNLDDSDSLIARS